MNATDYATLKSGAGLLALPGWGVLDVTGADRTAFLHNLLSNDIKALAPGNSCRAALLTPAAKMIAELVVVTEVDRHWLLTPRACLASLLSTLDRYLITEQVALSDRSGEWAIQALQGPKTPQLVSTLSGVRTAAYSMTGDAGVLLMAKSTVPDLPPVGWDAVNVCRVEAGVPWWGADMDEHTLLPETGLEQQLASFTKGCYVGQEIVARMDTYGSASRKLMRVTCEGTEVPAAGDAIHLNGEEIGRITSAVFSPSLNRPVALGYVKRPHYQTGTPVTVVCHGRSVSAVVEQRKG